MTSSRYIHSFWPIDNQFQQSLAPLNRRIEQSILENSKILKFLKNLCSIETLYSQSLKDLVVTKNSNKEDDDSLDLSSLSVTYTAIKNTLHKKSNEHAVAVESLRDNVIQPLTRIFMEYQLLYQELHSHIEGKLNEFSTCLATLKLARTRYAKLCGEAEALENLALSVAQVESQHHNKDSIYIFGKLVLGPADLPYFFTKIQKETCLPQPSHKFFNMFQRQENGEAIVTWLLGNYPDLETPQDGVDVAQALLDQKFLKGNSYQFEFKGWYTWERKATELVGEEPDHFKARKVAAEADHVYKMYCKKADKLRLQLEVMVFTYLQAMENNEVSRIESIKAAFVSLAGIESNLNSSLRPISETLLPHLETFKPQQDLQLLIEQYRTGSFRPQPIVYHNHYHGPGLEQSFGVPLDVQAKLGHAKIPPVFTLLIETISESLEGCPIDERRTIWCAEPALAEMHPIRHILNQGELPEKEELKKRDLGTLAATLRLYLLELPDSLVPEFLYEPLKSIAAESDSQLRCKSIGALLKKDLSKTQYLTLHTLFSTLQPLVEGLAQDDAQFYQLVVAFTPTVVRPPPHLNRTSHHHRHPQRLCKDLLLHLSQLLPPLPDLPNSSTIPNEIELIEFIDDAETLSTKPTANQFDSQPELQLNRKPSLPKPIQTKLPNELLLDKDLEVEPFPYSTQPNPTSTELELSLLDDEF